MSETSEDFSVHRFVQELFEDLGLTLPALGCRFEGVVTPSSLTVHGRALFLKNQLFLLFADLASHSPHLSVKFRPAVRGTDLVLGFFCQPFDPAVMATLPTWDPTVYATFASAEGAGFHLDLPAGQPLEVGPPVHWRQLGQLYGGAANGRKVLDHFLVRSLELMADLQAAISAADAPAVLRVAHTLKGSARGVTAEALAEDALQLEMAGRAGDLSTAPELYKALQVSYDEFIRWVREGQS
jgi:HPt (histidine-containing phosphotransfer) domain-containing protein